MKKIGIITLVFFNYGTRLQSFALCKVLESLTKNNAEIEVVNMEGFWSNKVQNYIVLFIQIFKAYKIYSFRKLYEIIKWLYINRKINKKDHSEERKKRIHSFSRMNSLIPYTQTYYSGADIRNGKLPQYDIVLVGSDQVWNGKKVGNQDIFMLDFLKRQKGITYAASFGMTTIPSNQLSDYKRRINNFSSLLIREKEGVNLCKQLGRNDAHLVLDPTLLLEKKDYQSLLNNSTIKKDQDFILVYSLNWSLKIYDEAYKLANKSECKMVVLKRSFCPPDTKKKYPGAEELYDVSPEDFLCLIENAKCVVTNSYHALLFSINFKSNFYLYLDNADEENSRLLTITSLLGLESHVYWETGNLPKSIISIDYEEPHSILNKERELSRQLLKASLEKYDVLS